MSVENQFSKYAKEYNSNNIIQQIIAKALVRDIQGYPKKILELGCGSGQVYNYIDWDIDHYKAIDFSQAMCALHPKNSYTEVCCVSFDSPDFFDKINDTTYDLVLSASALQWSKDLKKVIEQLSRVTSEINAVLFTSNTFKTIQKISQKKSPILDSKTIKEAFNSFFDCEFEIYNYDLKFDNKKELFDYIKNSGVSGNDNSLPFKEAKNLYKKYDLDYLEFEVIFVKAISRS